jgi:ABC-type Zn uptake system ZnuABC Zn-binding protein ZnuA
MRFSLTALRSTAQLAAAGLVLAAVAGCSAGGASGTAPTPALHVVASSTVFADLVRNVGGPDVEVDSLVPAGADVHTFDPTPGTIAKLAHADVVVMNGLGVDDWLDNVVADAGAVAPVKLGEGLDVPLIEDEAGPNPHLWMDVAYAKLYAGRITDALVAADPAHEAGYRERAAAYGTSLDDLDAWVRGQIDTVPAADRRVVTMHDAFPYYARAYGLDVVGVAVGAPGQDPSAAEITALVNTIRETGVKAVFAEDQFSPKLVETLASETGATVVDDLFDDSLGKPPVTSYEQLIRWDTERIVEALR